jgi:hypothetical protein
MSTLIQSIGGLEQTIRERRFSRGRESYYRVYTG